jgi:tryptophan synthase alpha subunit
MSERFLVSGKAGLQALESGADTLELGFEKSRQELLDMVRVAGTHVSLVKAFQKLESTLEMFQKLANDVTSFLVRQLGPSEPNNPSASRWNNSY